jgi:hypothetical protein
MQDLSYVTLMSFRQAGTDDEAGLIFLLRHQLRQGFVGQEGFGK